MREQRSASRSSWRTRRFAGVFGPPCAVTLTRGRSGRCSEWPARRSLVRLHSEAMSAERSSTRCAPSGRPPLRFLISATRSSSTSSICAIKRPIPRSSGAVGRTSRRGPSAPRPRRRFGVFRLVEVPATRPWAEGLGTSSAAGTDRRLDQQGSVSAHVLSERTALARHPHASDRSGGCTRVSMRVAAGHVTARCGSSLAGVPGASRPPALGWSSCHPCCRCK